MRRALRRIEYKYGMGWEARDGLTLQTTGEQDSNIGSIGLSDQFQSTNFTSSSEQEDSHTLTAERIAGGAERGDANCQTTRTTFIDHQYNRIVTRTYISRVPMISKHKHKTLLMPVIFHIHQR